MIERPAGVSNGFFGSHPPALLDPAVVDLVDAFLFANPGGRDRLIPLLQCVQDELGHLPMEAQELVADRLAMSPIQVAGVVSFYDLFTVTPRAPFEIRVCAGTACHVQGGERVLDALTDALGVTAGGISADGLFNLERGHCIGACGLAPVIAINGEYHANLVSDDIPKILNAYREKE